MPLQFRFCALLLGLFACPALLPAGTGQPLHGGWNVQSACRLQAGGAAIAREGFSVDGWLPATVPATVLAAQVADKVFPDPYFGDRLRHLPGMGYPLGDNFSNLPMPADSPYRCGWWYRTEFHAAPAGAGHEHSFLHFGGINYSAEIWLNGQQIADRSRIAGAYRTYDLDVTGILHPGAANVLAVETFAPTEKNLGINWVDWNPAPPDKDMGLTGAVDLVTTGAVTVRYPMAVTHFPEGSLHTADLTIYAELHNATDAAVHGTLSGTAAGAVFKLPVELAAHETTTVAVSPAESPALHLADPELWWPAQMGTPHLEPLTVRFTADGVVTDEQSVRFGIREITSQLTASGARLFRINGEPLLIRGGGWSQDMLLRTDAKRLRQQFDLVRDLNLNTIRLEGKLETDDFFRLADERGILIMAGWCCCDHWERWKTWTAQDHQVAAASLHDQLLRLRHHPSLLVWLNGSDNAPPPDVDSMYLKVEAQTNWPNPLLASASETDTPGQGPSGVKMTGPYDYVEPSYWYAAKRFGGDVGFNTETSPGPAVPSLASRKLFLPDPDVWPPTADWDLHNGGGGFTKLSVFTKAMSAIYTAPQSAAAFTRMAQTMEYDSERAMFESYCGNKYDSTGVIQWMLNNAWPSMIWHLYDYNLDAGGGYYGVKKALEPVHIQYAYDTGAVLVVNSTYQKVDGLHAFVQVHDLAWHDLFHAQAPVGTPADSSQQVALLPQSIFTSGTRIVFIDLRLEDAAGKTVSHNFYWVPATLTTFDWEATTYTHTPALRYPDLTALTQLPMVTLQSSAAMHTTAHGREIEVQLSNPSSNLAFQLHAAVRTADGGLIAPVLWSENWIELAPGESTTLTAQLPDTTTPNPVIKLDGWNVAPVTLTPAP